METITSRDGTRIAFWRGGTGPPRVLVHGMVVAHGTTWRCVIGGLARRFAEARPSTTGPLDTR